jgi:hypothetical protein
MTEMTEDSLEIRLPRQPKWYPTLGQTSFSESYYPNTALAVPGLGTVFADFVDR